MASHDAEDTIDAAYPDLPPATAPASPGPAEPERVEVGPRYRFTGPAVGDAQPAFDVALGRPVTLIIAHDAETAARRDRALSCTARLQHPGVPAVFERGVLPDGSTYHAMTPVAGRTLADETSARATTRERLALLPHLASAADTVAYAHGRGVVHGALDARAIVVGRHGEVLVIDWNPAAGEAHPRDDARALGAVLAGLLAGSEPPPRPAGVPAPLAAIVTRATAGGYDGAAALADDLHRFIAGRLVAAHHYRRRERIARWARRRARWLVPGAAALVSFAVIATVMARGIVRRRDEAVAAERAERRQRAKAEALASFVSGDLADQLTAVGRLALYLGTAERGLAYYDRVAPLDHDQRLRRADLLIRLALARRAAGELGPSRRDLDEAIASLPRDADDCAVAVARATAHDALAVLQQQAGDQGAAAFSAATAEADAELCLDDPVAGVRARALRGQAMARRVWSIRVRGDKAQAIALGRAAVDELRALRPGPADVELVDQATATAYLRLGEAYREARELRPAGEAFEGLRATARAGLARTPLHAGWLEHLANAEAKLGYLAFLDGDVPGAVTGLTSAIADFNRLRRLDPDNLTWMRLLAIAWNNLGRVYERGSGDDRAARAAYREDYALTTRLAASAPTRDLWQADLATTARNLGRLEARLGDRATARELLAQSVTISAALVARHADDLDDRTSHLMARYDTCRFARQAEVCGGVRAELRALSARLDPQFIEELHLVGAQWDRLGRAGTAWHDAPACQQACHR